MNAVRLNWTTATGGAASVDGTFTIHGELYAIDYLPGDTATGATVVVSDVGFMTHTLLSKASAGTANLRFYPRDLVHGAEDGAALTGAAGGDRAEPLLAGVPRVVISAGGDAKKGSVIIHYED